MILFHIAIWSKKKSFGIQKFYMTESASPKHIGQNSCFTQLHAHSKQTNYQISCNLNLAIIQQSLRVGLRTTSEDRIDTRSKKCT